MDILDFFRQTYIDLPVMSFRLFLALLSGAFIGLEREVRRQPAGLRTHILISLGSALLMLLSIYIPQEFPDFKNGDPGRIAAQVVSGIGFLGAGAILKLGNNIKGLTTAASIWTASALGLAIGAGMYLPSLVALAFVLFVLIVLEQAEHKLFPPERTKHLHLYVDDTSTDMKKIIHILEGYRITVISVDAEQSLKNERVKLAILVKIPVATDILKLYKELKTIGKVQKIKLQERL